MSLARYMAMPAPYNEFVTEPTSEPEAAYLIKLIGQGEQSLCDKFRNTPNSDEIVARGILEPIRLPECTSPGQSGSKTAH